MSTQVEGTYEGEGPNVATIASGGFQSTTVPDVAKISASAAAANPSGQGRTGSVALTRRRQLRVSSESARAQTAISYSGGDQILNYAARGVYISTGGTLVCRLVDDTADATFSGLTAGSWYPLAIAIVRQSGSTVAGNLLY